MALSLPLSFTLVLIAAIAGGALAVPHLRFGIGPRPIFGALHGLVGALGLAALLPVLNGPPRGVAMGVGAFGRIAAVLLGIALVVGLGILMFRLRARRVPGGVIGLHATVAITGVVILAAYTLIG